MNINSEKTASMDLPTHSTGDIGSTSSQIQRPGASATSLSSAEESAARHTQLIAESAYLTAEKRNFSGGDPVQDWLLAEREINR